MIKINKLRECRGDQDMHGTKKRAGSKGAHTEVEAPIGSTEDLRKGNKRGLDGGFYSGLCDR